MAIIISESKNPYFNLALEEYLLKNDVINEDIALFWQSEKAFVFGRNQNPFVEINPSFFNTSIPIIRRVSGGGTIYQDSNTLVFSFITKNYEKKINDYEYFLKPIIEVLKNMNLDVSFKPKSHLFIDDFKISGNAQAFINNKLLHHGTLLIDTDLDLINEALVNYSYSTKGNHILSNKQKVANLNQFLVKPCNIRELVSDIIDESVKLLGLNKKEYFLREEDIEKIRDLMITKYNTWEWNFGKTKEFEMDMIIDGNMEKIFIDNGIVKDVSNHNLQYLVGVKFYSEEFFEKIK
ncbi:MAG: lipoate--protein ligase [Tenericutes bacterium HGW-Tenericutes-5]|jgi:lipoate-protein ligase A|nr:MAG: lipoate--protein ligase [Tenericutes bacterium HGW-Tenericutes-5]